MRVAIESNLLLRCIRRFFEGKWGMGENFTIAIPARMASSRLPGKMLALLGGKPVLQHVIERVKRVRGCRQVYVVTDSEEIASLAKSLDICGLITSPKCTCGTERIASVLEQIDGDIIFNVQGDEPFIEPQLLEEMAEKMTSVKEAVLMPSFRLQSTTNIFNPSVTKVVCDEVGRALYFSRSPIPYVRDCDQSQWTERHGFFGVFGVYGFRREALEAYRHFPMSPLEKAESLEQLRWLSNGYHIATYLTEGYRALSIDTAEDLRRAEELIRS